MAESAPEQMEEELLDYGDHTAEAHAAEAGNEGGAASDEPAAEAQQADAQPAQAGDAAQAMEAQPTEGAADEQPAATEPTTEHVAGAAAAAAPAAAAAEPGSSKDLLSLPPHGTEVYIANLAMDASDAQIRAFVETMGEVWQLRLPKNPDGRNRGYGFCVYRARAAAEAAVAQLNQSELPDFPGRKVRVDLSQVKNRLFLGNLPRALSLTQLEDEVKRECIGVEQVELMLDRENPDQNRGFGFVAFYNNACAEQARRKYTEQAKTIGGRTLTVMWAEPRREDTVDKTIKSVYVGQLPETVTDEKLTAVFAPFGEVDRVTIPTHKDDPSRFREFAFVHFKDRASALAALAKHSEAPLSMDGAQLAVQMAKQQQHSDHPHPPAGVARDRERERNMYGPPAGRRGPPPPHGGGRYPPPRGGPRGGYSRYEDDYYEDDYGGGYGGAAAAPAASYGLAGAYGAAAAGYGAAAAATGGTVMMPVQLPNGQIGYMVMPTGTAAAGGPVRRAATALGGAGAAYGAGAGAGAGAGGYGAAAPRSGGGAGAGAGGGGGGRPGGYRPY